MRLITLLFTVFILFDIHGKLAAQDTSKVVNRNDTATSISNSDTTNLINQLENETNGAKTVYARATFKSTRVINGHSVENLPAHVLDVRISHRFGPLSGGLYQFFGLDYKPFNVRVGFDYGITNNFMIGVGHNAWQKTYDGFFKVKILRQSSGSINVPLTLSFVTTAALNTFKAKDVDPLNKPQPDAKINPLSYVVQLLAGRKLSEGFSLQVMPTYVHSDNISFSHFKGDVYKRDIFALGIAASQKISRKMSINGEYYYQFDDSKASKSRNALSFGIDIGTGGHVFQLLFTNSFGLTEKAFITETNGQWDNGDALFGFNISRVFQLDRKHKGGNADWKK